MLSDYLLYFSHTSLLILFCAAGYGVYAYKRLPPPLRLLTAHLLFAALIGVVSFLMWREAVNNMPLLHFFTLAECLLLSWVYLGQMNKVEKAKRIGIWLSAMITLAIIANAIFFQPIYGFNSYARVLESTVLIILSSLWLSKANEDNARQIEYRSFFWINSAILVYFSASLFVFLFSNYVSSISRDLSKELWALHAFINIPYYILIFIGLWKTPK